MFQKRVTLVLAAIVLILASLACSFSVSSANIKDAALTSDYDGQHPTSTFSPDQTFYLQVELANAPEDTALKAVWIAADVEEVEPGYVIDEVEITTDLPIITFDLGNDNYWPAGDYQVDLYLDGELDQSLEFEVR